MPEKRFEKTIVKNFPNIGKKIITQVKEAHKINPRRNSETHIIQMNKNKIQIKKFKSNN